MKYPCMNTLPRYLLETKIYLFGAYKPKDCKENLKEIRDFIKNKGFKNTYIVEDISDKKFMNVEPIRRNVERSFFAIDDADILIFIFSKNDKSNGHYMEYQRFVDNHLKDKVDQVIIFIEKKLKIKSLQFLKGSLMKKMKNLQKTSGFLHHIILGI